MHYLTHRFADAATIRDTLVTLSLFRLPLSVVALVVAGTWQPLAGTLWLIPAAVLGYIAGQRIFSVLQSRYYERATLLLLLVAAGVATAAAFT